MKFLDACYTTLIKLGIDTSLLCSNYFSDKFSLAIPETNKNQSV